jgi:hypothetical protein
MRAITVALSILVAGFAFQAKADDTGLSLGARLGYGAPMGDAGKDQKLSGILSSSIPLVLEANYRVTRNWVVGAYFQYAYATEGSDLSNACGGPCTKGTASSMRYGIQGQYRFSTPGMTPWIGIGFGAEAISAKISAGGNSLTLKANSNFFGDFQVGGGVEWTMSKGFTVGPFLNVTYAKYTKLDSGSGSESIPSDQQTWHEWLQIGVKGTFDL